MKMQRLYETDQVLIVKRTLSITVGIPGQVGDKATSPQGQEESEGFLHLNAL